MAVTYREDGSFAWDRMRDSTRDELRKAIEKEPRAKDPIDLKTAPASTVSLPPVAGEAIAGLIDALTQIVVAKATGATMRERALIAMTADEKKALAEPSLALLEKYTGSMFSRFPEEAQFLTVWTTIVFVKIMTVRSVIAQSKTTKPISIVPPVATTEPSAMESL